MSVVLFIHLSFCLPLHKAIYITSATAGVKSYFLTVLVGHVLGFRIVNLGKSVYIVCLKVLEDSVNVFEICMHIIHIIKIRMKNFLVKYKGLI